MEGTPYKYSAVYHKPTTIWGLGMGGRIYLLCPQGNIFPHMIVLAAFRVCSCI